MDPSAVPPQIDLHEARAESAARRTPPHPVPPTRDEIERADFLAAMATDDLFPME